MPESPVRAPAPPQPPPLPDAAAIQTAPRTDRRGPVGRCLHFIAVLLIGTSENTGWTMSVCVHILSLLLLGLILIPREQKEPPRILTAANALERSDTVGQEITTDFVETEPASAPNDALNSAASIAGSGGDVRPDLSLLFGSQPAAGLGRGAGAGEGDGSGKEADARIAKAGGRGGVVQVAMLWDDRNDLDLHIINAQKQRICFLNPTTPDGGELDVDMNVNGESMRPVENIRWVSKAPPDGIYRVQVHYFARHDTRLVSPFRVVIRLGPEERIFKGIAQRERQFTEVATFQIKDGQPGVVTSELKDFDEKDVPEIANDPRRGAQREEFARAALTEALAVANAKVRSGKLRRLVERFPGTEAAAEARKRLDEPQ